MTATAIVSRKLGRNADMMRPLLEGGFSTRNSHFWSHMSSKSDVVHCYCGPCSLCQNTRNLRRVAFFVLCTWSRNEPARYPPFHP